MLSIDDRTGNVMTTVAVFVITAAILYLARGAFFVLVLSLLFAYLLEPAVGLVQRHARLGRGNRTWAIAQVCLGGLIVLGSLGYAFGPRLVGQMKSLNAGLPQILQGLSDGRTAADFEAQHGMGAATQQQIHDWLARNHDSITRVFERGAASAASLTESVVWLFAVPILAIFILQGRSQLAGALVQAFGRGPDQAAVKRILTQVDAMLAKYVRAQLTLSGLSVVFYSASMVFLKFPYAIALGVLGGVLEFLPVVGWIASAAVILTIGFLTYAHWTWMAILVVLWRFVQSYVFSPLIMGNTLQLQPLTVLFALMVGGQVGGIAGLYLAIPVAAVLRIIWMGRFSAESSPDGLDDQHFTQVGA
jgi:predicted PurR-regulated permease PerM